MILNLSNNIPLYEQIIFIIKNQILNGEILAGDALPSIRNLSNDLSVSVITVKKAYEELENQGFIYAISAKGYFVSANNVNNLRDIAISKIEKDLDKIIITAKGLSLSKEDFIEIVNVLYEDF